MLVFVFIFLCFLNLLFIYYSFVRSFVRSFVQSFISCDETISLRLKLGCKVSF